MSWTNICIVGREKIIEIAENRYCGKIVTQKILGNLKKYASRNFTKIKQRKMIDQMVQLVVGKRIFLLTKL